MTAALPPTGVQPLVDTRWLALPVSARGLVDELQKYADETGRVALRLSERIDACAIGNEIARLLCAHRGELARVRKDAQTLLDDNAITIDGSSIRICRMTRAYDAVQKLERPRAMTDAERSQLRRDRERASRDQAVESSPNVTNVTVERDDFRDDRHGASVTRPLSFKEDLDLKTLKEREGVTPIVTATRDAAPETINEARRAKAVQLGLQDHRIHLVWIALVAKHAGHRKTEVEWDNRWISWVTKQLLWDSAKRPPAPKGVAKTREAEPTWIRKAMGDT